MQYLVGFLIFIALAFAGLSYLWEGAETFLQTSPDSWMWVYGIIGITTLIFFLFYFRILKRIHQRPTSSKSQQPETPKFHRNYTDKHKQKSRHEEHLINIAKSPPTAKKKLLNAKEQDLYTLLVKKFGYGGNFIIAPQVALRAIINTNDYSETWKSIGGKHMDFLFCDRKTTQPLLVVEYHGSGHFGNTEESRQSATNHDEIKTILLREAKIDLVIIEADDSEDEIIRKISEKIL